MLCVYDLCPFQLLNNLMGFNEILYECYAIREQANIVLLNSTELVKADHSGRAV
jgi:hypothetical protein